LKQSDPPELVEAGTLLRPGPVGRLVRLGLGGLCLCAIWVVFENVELLVAEPTAVLNELTVMIAAALWIFNYVVNIGFSKSWNRRPLIVSVTLLALSAGAAFVWSGSLDSPLFGIPFTVWLVYFYGHLGISFVLAASIGTPGCEMRSIPDLIGRMTGKLSKEHHCPASFVTKIDAWERERGSINR
jgi:hypothetical protein